MDVHVPSAITRALRQRGLDVLTAQDDNAERLADTLLLDRATALKCLMCTMDHDYLVEAARRRRDDLAFATIVFLRAQNLDIGRCVDDLELFATVSTDEETRGKVVHLPFK